MISLKGEIKQVKIVKNRNLDGLGYNFKLLSEEKSEDMCFHLFWKLTGEIKNLKNEVINLKDDIMKMSAAKDREKLQQ